MAQALVGARKLEVLQPRPASEFAEHWVRAGLTARRILDSALEAQAGVSEPAAVRALSQVLGELPDTHLHVTGRCRSADHIHALAKSVGVQQSVTFYGEVPPARVAAMLAGADMFVMPSRTEALGLVYLEAFRAGVPVIAGDRGGVTEIVHDRTSGILVTPGSPGSLASSIVNLARDEKIRSQLVVGGREVLAGRPPERLIAETLSAYGLETPSPSESAEVLEPTSLAAE